VCYCSWQMRLRRIVAPAFIGKWRAERLRMRCCGWRVIGLVCRIIVFGRTLNGVTEHACEGEIEHFGENGRVVGNFQE
jgi:hypothetical protein